MIDPDWVAGGISIALGLMLMAVGLFSIDWFYQLPKIQWIQRRWGRPGARLVFCTLGLALVVWGAAIACGWTLSGSCSLCIFTPDG